MYIIPHMGTETEIKKGSIPNAHHLKLPKGVLKVKQGYNPNSSSIGTLVYAFPMAFIALSGTLAFLATLKKKPKQSDEE